MENYRGMEVLVIIVTFNGMPWIKRCLDSCRAYPVLVIDNASEDDTVSFVKSNFKEVTIIESKSNLGFGQANNLGISKALQWGVERVFLLNQDAYLKNQSLEYLVKEQQQKPEYGILSPIHLNGTGTALDQQFFKHVKGNSPNSFKDSYNKDDTACIHDVKFVNAAGWLVNRACLEMVGGFDPIFFHYGEDDNYCQRVRYHGMKVGVYTGSFILHDREERDKSVIKKGSLDYWIWLERRLKKKYADINETGLITMRQLLYKRSKSLISSLLKLQFNRANSLIKEIMLIGKILPVVKKSKRINRLKGVHYIPSERT